MSRRPRLGRLPAALAVIVALLALALPTVAAAEGLRTTLNEIESEVMCPVCGTLLELAESPQATREKAFVEKLVKEGKDKAQIKDALVAQYGDAVLALPKGSGFSLSAYVVPIVAFIVAAVLLALAVWKWRLSAGSRRKRDSELKGPSDEDRQRLDDDLARYDL
jgi:cytochrome c-type biogenesis protein CcmH